MAVSLVGTGTFITSSINGVALTLTFSTGGAASGDLVIAWWANPRSFSSSLANLRSSSSTAYTVISSTIQNHVGVIAAYRQLTSSETTVRSCATGSAMDSVMLSAIVLRGHNTTPFISGLMAASLSSQPDSPAITETAPGSAFITAYAQESSTPLTVPSGFLNLKSTSQANSRQLSAGLAWKSTSGTVDPGVWGGAAVAADWVAVSISVRSTETATFTWSKTSYFPDLITYNSAMIGY